jgi:hypothetical protein
MFVPSPEALARLADEIGVHLRSTDAEWHARSRYSAPGIVWVAESDTCLTGRLEAPDNVGYDKTGGEFIFRQPRDEQELSAVLRAACADPFDAYRFDGLERWTRTAALEWYATRHTLVSCLDYAREINEDVAAGMRAACEYFASDELDAVMLGLLSRLR